MRRYLGGIGACAMLAAVLGAAAGAQTPKASPTPALTPAAFSARAHANVNVILQGGTYAGTAQLAMAQRADLTRVDVLSVKSDSFPIPPIAVTVVIDRRANTLTLWSDTTKLYRVQPFIPRPGGSAAPSASPRPSATPRAARAVTSPFSNLDVLDVTLHLTGHTTTAGIPTTGLAFDLLVRKKGQQAGSHVSATTQLADEFAVFPMTLELSLEPGATPFGAKLSYAVDELTRGLPALTSFTVPAGYTEAPSLMNVIFPRR